MATVSVRVKTLQDGSRSYTVRYRRGGRFYPLEHAGTFRRRRDADARADRIRTWLAQGLDPQRELARLLEPSGGDAVPLLAERWIANRRRVKPGTVENLRSRQKRIDDRFPGAAAAVTVTDVIDWIGEMLDEPLAPGSISLYVGQLRQLLDFADVDPNPARDRRVELPRNHRKEPRPPDADAVLAVLNRMPRKHRLQTVFMEQTGARVTETCELAAADLDVAGCRVLIRGEHAKTSRPRWLELPDWLCELVQGRNERIFPTTRQAVYQGIAAGGRLAGVRWHPHALRHRRATLWHQQGVPLAEIAARLGHARPSMSLEVYAHVLPLREIPVEAIVQALR